MPPFNFLECRANRIYMEKYRKERWLHGKYISLKEISVIFKPSPASNSPADSSHHEYHQERMHNVDLNESCLITHRPNTLFTARLLFYTPPHRTCCAANPSSNLEACSHRSHPASTYLLYPLCRRCVYFHMNRVVTSGAMSDMFVLDSQR